LLSCASQADIVAAAHRGRADAGDVAADVWLRQPEGEKGLALNQLRQPAELVDELARNQVHLATDFTDATWSTKCRRLSHSMVMYSDS
jgi:hypothetical protein